MNKFIFYTRSLSGKGWFIPLSDLLSNTEFKQQAVQLADKNIFYLSDVSGLLFSGKLNDIIQTLNLGKEKSEKLEAYLIDKVDTLRSFDKKQKWILPIIILVIIISYFLISIMIAKYNQSIINEYKSLNKEVLIPQSPAELNDLTKSVNINTIGKWKTPILYGGGELLLENLKGKYFKTETFEDNSVIITEMKLTMEGNNLIFREINKKSSDYWVVLENGDLEVRDINGLIYKTKPVN